MYGWWFTTRCNSESHVVLRTTAESCSYLKKYISLFERQSVTWLYIYTFSQKMTTLDFYRKCKGAVEHLNIDVRPTRRDGTKSSPLICAVHQIFTEFLACSTLPQRVGPQVGNCAIYRDKNGKTDKIHYQFFRSIDFLQNHESFTKTTPTTT